MSEAALGWPDDDPFPIEVGVGSRVLDDTLAFHTLAELRARVKQAGPRRWLVRGVWPAAAYGVHAAEQKAQKSWNAYDLAVSVAGGAPWLGHFPVDDPGPVLVFAGEGGEAAILRRLDAIAEHKGLEPDQLRIAVCARAPHLSNLVHMSLFVAALERYQPRLVVLDPLYLAARGAKIADLYLMGELLEVPQRACTQHGASLFVVHHYNRARDQRGGSKRMSGAGPAEWGRVLIGADVVSRHTDPDTTMTRVLTELDVIGGEIADARFRILRTVVADKPDDLDSPLHYTVQVFAVDDPAYDGGLVSDLAPAAAKLLEAMTAAGEPRTVAQLVDWIAETHGHGLTRETTSRHLNDLAKRGRIDSLELDQVGGRWPIKAWFVVGKDSPQ